MCNFADGIGVARRYFASLDSHAYARNDNDSFGFVAAQTLLVDRRSRILWNDEESL